MKKKIVIMSEALGGGVRRHIIDLIENLDKDIFEIYFIFNLDRADSIIKEKIHDMRALGINLIEIDSFKKKIGINDIRAYKEIYTVLKKINPDIIHCHSSKAGVLGRVVAKVLRIKQVYYTPHAYYFQNPELSTIKKRVYILVETILSKYFTTMTINVSNGEKEIALRSKLDKEEKFCVVYNGIEESTRTKSKNINILREFNINKDDIVIGVIARLNDQKDPHTFIDIAKKVREVNDKIKFIYVGDGNLYDEISNRIHTENIDNVILAGFRSNIEDFLNTFDIFLTTALYEGMPYSLIEALRTGLPIVATDVIGNNEIVMENINGHLFKTKKVDDAVKIILEIINLNKICNMSIQSLLYYEKMFSIDNMIKNYESLYLKNNI